MEKKANIAATVASTAVELVNAAHVGPQLDDVVRVDDVPYEGHHSAHLENETPSTRSTPAEVSAGDALPQHVVFTPVKDSLPGISDSKVRVVKRDADGNVIEIVENADYTTPSRLLLS